MDNVSLGSPSKTQLVGLIVERIESEIDDLRMAFINSREVVGTGFVVIDNLLPENIAQQISESFPAPESMRHMKSFRENKYTSKNFEEFDPILGDITFAIQDPSVVELVEKMTGIQNQVPDSLLYAGGLSVMTQNQYLGPHIDNSHDSTRTYYRTLNLLYYVSAGWSEKNGGHLQLWDRTVNRNITIPSLFNRLVIMETNATSWHSVNDVKIDGHRKCVSNYYFSKTSPAGEEYFNITAFSAPSSQPLLRIGRRLDATARQLLRLLKPSGIQKQDVYEGPPR